MKHFPWRRLVIVILTMLVVGNAIMTLVLYALGLAHLTAWTGHVPQSTPSALNDMILGVCLLVLSIALLKRHE